eukprot:CAMPEP_0175133222 /NCGR_PEP_ID=MMETSP0087-20121206/7521_1 /TAXON_ID=136419 /ORGANISM="Unknown Unknown, Strain D1" /LENGTH=573 /DNA_ID=CAMNT_0016415685 /DNA_START=215 /DNA_END=1936 /DNA_ORIENTATION=-
MINQSQRQALTRVKELMLRLHHVTREAGIQVDEEELLNNAISNLESVFLLVVVGEFNSGKSQLINSLIGSEFCETGVLPTTENVNILVHGPQVKVSKDSKNIHRIFLPVPLLRETNIVDTPGTNAILTEHQDITEHFVPRSDLVIFVTSVDRPFSESERKFLRRIDTWKKKVVMVVNKKDLIDPENLEKVVDFVKTNASQELRDDVQVFALSAKAAMQFKAGSQPGMKEGYFKTGFKELEDFVTDALKDNNKIRLKMENPLGIADHLVHKYMKVVQAQQGVLRGDLAVIKEVMDQLDQFKVEMQKDFLLQVSKLDNVFLRMMEKTDAFLEDTLSIGNIGDLVRADVMKTRFDQMVNKDVSEELQESMVNLVDWMAIRTERQAELVAQNMSRAISPSLGRAANCTIGSDFLSNRISMVRSLQNHARATVSPDYRQQEQERLVKAISTALYTFAAVEVSAVGLGALFTAALFDWTGIAGAGLLAITGFAVVPHKRQRLRKDMKRNIVLLQTRTAEVTHKHFSQELDASVEKITQSIAPFTRYVQAENSKFQGLVQSFEQLAKDSENSRNEIRKVT